MTTFFQAAEIQDFDSRTGVLSHITATSQYRTSNARCAIVFPSTSGDFTNSLRGVFKTATGLEHWGKHVFATNGSASTPLTTYMRMYSGGVARWGLQWGSSGLNQILMRKNTTSFTTLLSTINWGTSFIATNTPYEIDWYMKIGNPGIFRLYLNKSLVMASESLDLSWSGVTGFDEIQFGQAYVSNGEMRISEVMVTNWSTLGGKLVTAAPNANGNYSEWAGAGYTSVNEITPDLVVLTSPTANQRSSFNITVPALATGEDIASVRANAYAYRGTTGPQNLNLFTRIGGVNYDTADQAAQPIYTGHSNYWELSPATSLPWTVAEIKEFGLRSRT